MRGIEIRDGISASGFLDFDLADILDALSAFTAGSVWRCRGLEVTSRDDAIDVHELERASESESGVRMTTDELSSFARRISQVIDGEFVATRPRESDPCVIVRAVDSSWWEVFSSDDRIIDAARSRFRDLRDVAPVQRT